MRPVTPIVPRGGEHPLWTAKRKLHRELSRAYLMVTVLLIVGSAMYLLTDQPDWAKTVTAVGALIAVALTEALSFLHWRWSK